jgi:dynactin complex subunit
MSLVEDTFSDNRNKVVTRSNEGKTENSRLLRTCIVSIKIAKAVQILSDIKISSSHEGSGMKSIVNIRIIIRTIALSPLRNIFPVGIHSLRHSFSLYFFLASNC